MKGALLLLAGLAAVFALPAIAQPVSPASGTIEVVGHASHPVTPDQAIVHIGVSTRAASPAAALDDNSAAARRVAELARSMGIEPADIRTSSVSLTPNYRPTREAGGQPAPDGYSAENQVEIRVRDLARVGELLRRAVEGGANRINGLSFGLADPRNADEEARRGAVNDAFRQARLLADAAGVKLGPIRRITFPPQRDGGPVPVRGVAMRAMGAPVPVQAGSLEVSAEVEVTWAIEQP
ncbi:MAG TPA: SIMPL domain-containing protein [Methylobacterium sp.]|nr:SIMPL domain-containing protein [Methylobacterium sp.]